MKLLAVLLLAFSAESAHANELIVGHFSKHINSKQEMRESNPGIGYRTNIQGYDVQVGHYRNSYNRSTNYALIDTYDRPIYGDLSLRVMCGVVTGYAETVRPIILPTLSYQLTKSLAVDTIVIPPFTGTTVLAVSLRIKLN